MSSNFFDGVGPLDLPTDSEPSRRPGPRWHGSDRADIVIVGAGLAGLGCAVKLAEAGLSVTLLERASRAGGRALSPDVGESPMNLGAHALYLGGLGEAWLESLGVTWTGFKPAAKDTWLADEQEVFAAPGSVLALAMSRRFSLGERLGLMRLFATLDRIDPRELEHTTTRTWLDRVAPGPRALRFLETMARLTSYANAPDVLPASSTVRQLQAAVSLRAKGVVYLDGGWQVLVHALEQKARAAGVRIETNTRVERVVDGEGVRLETGQVITARHVIVALPIRAAQALTGVTSARNRTAARAATIDMVLAAAPARRIVLGLDEPHYFSVHSPVSTTTNVRAHAHRYLAPNESGAEYIHRVEAWLERVAPDAARNIVARRVLPEMEIMSALPDPASAPPALATVSFAGDWVDPNHLLFDSVAASAVAATARALAVGKARAAA